MIKESDNLTIHENRMYTPACTVKDISTVLQIHSSSLQTKSKAVWSVITRPSATKSFLMSVCILVLQSLWKPIIVVGHVHITVGKFVYV